MTDQQFCLRWNNHQSTLVAVFDGLLEKGVLVDCTLAAEGQQLTAHKVVLAACSPFLETLLSRHYDKHPILILKDVKFSELKAMMDYMYRGEVNISQDQLGTFLKAAESLQIKGLSDGGGNEKEAYPTKRHHERKPLRPTSPLRNSMPDGKRVPPPPPYLHNSIRNSLKSSPLLVDIPEDTPVNRGRDGSLSPVPRKKKRPRESEETLNNNVVVKSDGAVADEPAINHEDGGDEPARVPSPDAKPDPIVDKTDPAAHLKHELIEEEEDINEDSVELTLDEDDVGEAGPSHNDSEFAGDFYSGTQDGDNRDGQAKKYEPMKNGKDAEIRRALSTNLNLLNEREFGALYSKLAVGGLRYGGFGMGYDYSKGRNDTSAARPPWRLSYNIQDVACLGKRENGTDDDQKLYSCSTCKKKYRWKSTLRRHEMVECGGKEPAFQCPQCPYRAKQRGNLGVHMRKYHSAPTPSQLCSYSASPQLQDAM